MRTRMTTRGEALPSPRFPKAKGKRVAFLEIETFDSQEEAFAVLREEFGGIDNQSDETFALSLADVGILLKFEEVL